MFHQFLNVLMIIPAALAVISIAIGLVAIRRAVEADRDNADILDEIATTRESMRSRFDAVTRDIVEIRGSVLSHDTKMASLADAIREASNEVDSLESRIGYVSLNEADIGRLRKTLEDLSSRVENFATMVESNYKAAMGVIDERLMSNAQEIAKVRGAVAVIRGFADLAEPRIITMGADIKDLHEKIESLDDSLLVAQKAANVANTAVGTIRAAIRAAAEVAEERLTPRQSRLTPLAGPTPPEHEYEGIFNLCDIALDRAGRSYWDQDRVRAWHSAVLTDLLERRTEANLEAINAWLCEADSALLARLADLVVPASDATNRRRPVDADVDFSFLPPDAKGLGVPALLDEIGAMMPE